MKQETKFKDTEIGMIPEDWTVKELNELCTLITDGKHGDCKNEIYSAYYFLSCKDVNGGILHYSKARQITKQDFLEADKRTNLQIGNILLTNSGTIGRLAIAKDPEKTRRTTFQKSVAIVKNKQELIQSKFLYYYFMSKEREIKELSGGTTQKNLLLKDLRSFKVAVPNKVIQKSIAKILSDFDSKIELLQKQNKTLEAIALAIFKHWFIDFEFPNEEGKPYKSSGGEMVFNEALGKEIPKGWESRRLEELFKFVKGKKPRRVSEQYNDNYLPQILIETLDGKNPVFADPEKMILVDKKNPIMVMDGASSGRIEIGFIGILGSTLALLKINNSDFNNSVYYFLKTKEEDINKNTTGTSIPHTDKNKVYNYEVSLPENNNLANRFQKETSIIISKIILNKEKIRSLQKTRDLLLPKLMSGKIRVPVEVE